MSTREQTRGRVEGFDLGLPLARRLKGWTQKQLAEAATEIAQRHNPAARVSVAMVGMIESRERNPSLEVAGWLAEAVGFKIEELGRLRPEQESA